MSRTRRESNVNRLQLEAVRDGRPLVVHVLPADLSRGAQTYARALRSALDGEQVQHRTLTLFAAPPGALEPDLTLGIAPGWARRLGADLRAVRNLRRALRRLRPEAVVAHGGEPLKYCALAGAERAKLVYYKIGTIEPGLSRSRRLLLRAFVARAGAVAAVSADAAAEAGMLGTPAERISIIPNGRDPARYRERDARGAPAEPRLVFVGHLTATKRPELFVDLVAGLHAHGVRVTATMAGDGPMRAALEPSARAAGIAMLGDVADIPALLADCDLLVFTGAGPGEGMPGVLIEAGLAGLPVVTTAVAGARDVIADGVTGFVVPRGDLPALLASAEALVRDAALRQRMGAAARSRCASQFSMESSARRWADLLAHVIESTCESST